MRGKAGKHRGHVPASRITPAYAGKSPGDENRQDAARDHPRVCGEKKIANSDELAVEGSPPRMRGKVLKNRVKSGQPRITPAYAGKSFAAGFACHSFGDHPRVCGEKLQCAALRCTQEGSPPRMRGKGKGKAHRLRLRGITPAYAGKRLKRSRSTVPPVAIVPLFPSVCNKPVVSDGSPAGRDAPLFLPAENAVPASPAYNLRSL